MRVTRDGTAMHFSKLEVTANLLLLLMEWEGSPSAQHNWGGRYSRVQKGNTYYTPSSNNVSSSSFSGTPPNVHVSSPASPLARALRFIPNKGGGETSPFYEALESKLLEEQHSRINAEQEQSRLLTVNHELERQLEHLNQEFKRAVESTTIENSNRVREAERQVAEYTSKLQALEELKDISDASSVKYRGQAEQVIRTLESRQNEAEDSRRRAEEALARTVAAAHSKLTIKTSALAASEARLNEETNARTRLQQQMEQYTTEHQTTVASLEKQLAAAKSRELELSTRVTESAQRADDLARRLQMTDFNAANLKSLLSTPQQPSDIDPHTAVAQELDRIKRSYSKREAELNARVAEQNHLIRILRHALTTSNPSSAPIPLSELEKSSKQQTTTPTTPIQRGNDIQDQDSSHQKVVALQHTLQERDTTLQQMQAELINCRNHIDKLEEQRSTLLQKLESPSVVRTEEVGDDLVTSLRDELRASKAEVEQLRARNEDQQIKVLTLTAQLEESARRVEDLVRVASSADTMRAEVDESHENELKLLEQVEAYEYSMQQLRTRIAELEDFIVSADIAPQRT